MARATKKKWNLPNVMCKDDLNIFYRYENAWVLAVVLITLSRGGGRN